MRILLLHPADSPRYGPWSREKWDLIVDLGHSSESTVAAWEKLTGAEILRLDSLRTGVEDARQAGEILRTGCGYLVDRHGLDWWQLTSLFIHEELETAILLRRLIAKVELQGDLCATRLDWPVCGVAALVGKDVRSYTQNRNSIVGGVSRLSRSLSRLKLNQVIEIFWDKYDGDYRLRSRIPSPPARSKGPVVLLPSAYTNASRTATAYAKLLPDQQFLLIATRESATQFDRPPNVALANLSAYAGRRGARDDFMLNHWPAVGAKLEQNRDLALLGRTGVLDLFPKWLHDGPGVRDAWLNVLDREPVTAVLCGDDTNWYTRLPVLLARQRHLPTVDFHHGSLDGRFLVKGLPSDTYLAKSEMERDYLLRVCGLPGDRITLGAPLTTTEQRCVTSEREPAEILFFSEPYESGGARAEEIYRELLIPLCKLALRYQRRVVVKLHPFESEKERSRLLDRILSRTEREVVAVLSGPLSGAIFSKAWFAVTVQSTTVADCAERNVPCFLCGWLATSPYGYVEQFMRFGLGIALRAASEIEAIPFALAKHGGPTPKEALGQPIKPSVLDRLLKTNPISNYDSAPEAPSAKSMPGM